MNESIASMRRMIPDPSGSDQMFSDGELTGYFTDNREHVKLAVAAVWEALAGKHLLLFKANLRSDDGSVTSSAQSELYLRRARELRNEALSELNLHWTLAGGE